MTLSPLHRTQQLLHLGIERGWHRGAQLYVSRGASTLAEPDHLDLVIGERAPDQAMDVNTLNIWLSATKPVTAVALGLLWQDGVLDLDDPVAAHIPEFGQKGKDRITLRHLLTHTGGIRLLQIGWPEAGWQEIIETICQRRIEPRWTPGQKAGYHMKSSWFILGEVIARHAGQSFGRAIRLRVLEPCGMHNSWIGMPAERLAAYGDQLGRMWGTEGGTQLERRWHEGPSVIESSPGGNGRGPIRELGRFYEMLLRRGTTASGRQLLTPQTVEAMTSRHRVGLFDHTFKQKLDWGLGFIANSNHYGESHVAYGYGRHASHRVFGHSGFQSSTAMADPEHDLVIALVTNGQPGEPIHTQRFQALLEAIYQDVVPEAMFADLPAPADGAA